MTSKTALLAAQAAAMVLLASCSGGKPGQEGGASSGAASASPGYPVASAMSAAPEAVARDATIVAPQPDGTMKTLRPGNNGFSCMPDNPVTPGHDPMCMDGNAMAWVMAWVGHKPPPVETPGIMYMLEGGTDASNTDPYAQKPTEGGDWVHTGPHMMVVGSASLLKGYPAGPNPNTAAPYVMWAGTPYAHLMVPVK